jgi:hypothetical protein
VKRTHILGSLDLLDEAGKHNVKDLSSEGLSNSFPVDMSSASKHALESTNLIFPQENKKVSIECNLYIIQIHCLTFPTLDGCID